MFSLRSHCFVFFIENSEVLCLLEFEIKVGAPYYLRITMYCFCDFIKTHLIH